MDIKKLNQKLDEVLFLEMSMAIIDKQVHRNIWVENPNTYSSSDTEYFKYGDSESYIKESKCIRISLKRPEYIYHKNKSNSQGKVKDWALTNREIKELIDILNSPWKQHKELTNWQKLLFTYNQDRFQMEEDEFVENTWTYEQYPEAFRKDFPMPDYTKLEFDKSKAKNQIATR